MGWTLPDGIAVPEWSVATIRREASVPEDTTIGLYIAKNVFHAPGSDSRGRGVSRSGCAGRRCLTSSPRIVAVCKFVPKPNGGKTSALLQEHRGAQPCRLSRWFKTGWNVLQVEATSNRGKSIPD